jgi:RND family efflux transporter MFP subunit
MVSEGQYIRDGEPIAELVIEDTLKYVAKVPERYSNQVVLGQELTLRVASFEDRTFTGKLTRVNPTVDPISRTFQVEATIPNPKNELRPGGFAKADILIDRKGSGVVVPIEAVVRTVGVTKIFLVVDDEKSASKKTAREIQVTAGTEGAGWMEIIGKLPATGEVVTSGQSQLADGTPVRIKTPEEADDAGASNSVNASTPKVDAAKTAPVAK